jgi:hypothetical protein
MGTGLSSLLTLQSLPPHSYPTAGFHAASSRFSLFSHRPHRTASNASWFHILSHCSGPLHTMARSHPHSGHHSRNPGMRLLDRLDIPFRFPADYHHRSGTSVWVPTLPLSGRIMWYRTFSHDRLSPCLQQTHGKIPPDAEGSHHVPRRQTFDRSIHT